MSKLKPITIKNLKKIVPDSDFEHIIKEESFKSSFSLCEIKPIKKRDDSLIELEIAFRKCKRVGVFS